MAQTHFDRNWKAAFSLSLIPALVLPGCAFNAVPARTQDAVSTPSQPDSYLTAEARLSHTEIAAWANSIAPSRHAESAKIKNGCKVNGVRFGDLEYTIEVTRLGDLTVSGNSGLLRATGQFEAWGRLKCRLPGKINIRETTEPTGIGEVTADFSATFSDVYQLNATIQPGFRWIRRPKIKLFDVVNVSIGGISQKAIEGAIRDAAEKAKNDLAKIDIRGSLERVWKQSHEPLPVPIADERKAWILLRPVGLHSTRTFANEDHLSFRGSMRANPRMAFGVEPEVAPVPDLPIKNSASPPNQFQIQADAEVTYAALEEALGEQLAGKVLSFDEGTLTIGAIRAYQTNGKKLALGMDIVARPKSFLTARGRIWTIGTPTVDGAGTRISFPDLEYTLRVDNPAYALVDWVFHARVRDALRQNASVSLKPLAEELRRDLMRGGPIRIGPDAQLILQVDTVRLDYVLAGPAALRLGPSAAGTATMDLKVPKTSPVPFVAHRAERSEKPSTVEIEIVDDAGRVLNTKSYDTRGLPDDATVECSGHPPDCHIVGGRPRKVIAPQSTTMTTASVLALDGTECGLCRCIRRQPGSNRMEDVVVAERRTDSEAKCIAGCADVFGGHLGGANGYSYSLLDPATCRDCGRFWTGWKEVGEAVGNPCPRGCARGEEVGDDYRSVGLPPRPQHKHKFQCYGIAR